MKTMKIITPKKEEGYIKELRKDLGIDTQAQYYTIDRRGNKIPVISHKPIRVLWAHPDFLTPEKKG